jgi:hypothetical protein
MSPETARAAARAAGAAFLYRNSAELRRQLDHQVRLEQAVARLAACCPDGFPAVVVEVERREVLLAMGRLAAVQSVADDVVLGRWDPH